MTVRPHMVSYLAIPLVLYILEVHPRNAFVLPLIAVVWVNVHGIEFPVLIVIALAYLSELLLPLLRTRSALEPNERRLALSLVATMLTIFLTPHGRSLLRVPFCVQRRTGWEALGREPRDSVRSLRRRRI